MDQRQQQQQQQPQPAPHPFSRNTVSPYNRASYPPSSSQPSFPPTSHPPSSTPSYPEHQRRPSDPPFYNAQRVYGQDGPSMGGPGHVRHQSASSIGSGTPVNRGMPPPSSPQQDRPPYGSSRAQLSGGPAFGSGRELPALALGQRAGMSISDILGGPSVSREPAPQYGSPVATTAAPTSMFGPARGSPRNQSASSDYTPFRRPQTPEHHRFTGPRDHRANSAGSPPNPNIFGTPENRNFGPTYRVGAGEERREGPATTSRGMPPRPNSQPNSYNPAPSRTQDSRAPLTDFTRRIDHIGRHAEQPPRQESQYARSSMNDRQDPRHVYAERERLDREREAEHREREVREREQEMINQREREIQRDREIHEQRELRERAERERQQEYAHQLAQRNAQAYSRAPEREQAWNRSTAVYDASRPPYEQRNERPPQHLSSGYDYPGTSAPAYGATSAYAGESRYPQTTPTTQHAPATQYESSAHEEQLKLLQLQQQRQQQALYTASSGASSYPHESPVRRSLDDAQQMQQQRSLLGVQEINRKGRLSPLPQAVQGAQTQMNGPGGEPSIKNEFGRIFPGIGSGVGAMGAPSPVNSGPQSLPFSSTNQLRRDDGEAAQNSPVENGAPKMSRTASMGSRRRKLKEEETRADDEGSTGRRTPSGRGKRAKAHHHHHHTHHHHHHRADAQELISSPNMTPFKPVKGGPNAVSPPGVEKEPSNLHHHHVPISRPHHHHHHVSAKTVPQINPQIPLPNITIVSSAVLDSVKEMPRRHLGHCYYDASLKRTGNSINGIRKGTQGYSSTPKPLPLFDEEQYNCTYTVKVPRVNLTRPALQEITNRKALWGTDIYTDDSDVIAAAIHSGWFRGAWDDSIDVSLLGLDLPGKVLPKIHGPQGSGQILEQPPPDGPGDIPDNHDVHIDIIILPLLEGYSSTVRFGIKSREWGYKRDGHKAQHDGLSFMIHKVSFVTTDGGITGIRTRKKMAQQKNLAARNAEERRLANALKDNDPSAQFEESFERGGDGPMAFESVKGIATNSWWKPPQPKPKEATPEPREQSEPVRPAENHEHVPEPHHEAPRTPPRQEPSRHYVPLDPPIPSPISVIDPQTDSERATEMTDSVNVTPVKASGDNSTLSLDEAISPPRPVPDVIASPPPAIVPRRNSEREIISADHGFGGNVEVKREIISDLIPRNNPVSSSVSANDETKIDEAHVPTPSSTSQVAEPSTDDIAMTEAPSPHLPAEAISEPVPESKPLVDVSVKPETSTTETPAPEAQNPLPAEVAPQ